jgi:hypothetical protein
MTVDQVRAAQKSGKKLPKATVKAAKPKAAPEPAAAAAGAEADGLPPADEANVDSMAEEMINSIKSATENIKDFSNSGDGSDST